jgi:cell division septal protein FtsQ
MRTIKVIALLAVVTGVGAGGFAGAFYAIRWVKSSEKFTIKRVIVKGTAPALESKIHSCASIDTTANILDVKVKEIGERIEALVWVKKARIHRRYPNTIVIAVHQRSPIALVSRGHIYQLDEEGWLLPMIGEFPSSLPILTGIHDTFVIDSVKRLCPEVMQRIGILFDEMGNINPAIVGQISQIDISSEEVIRVKFESHPMIVSLGTDNLHTHFIHLERLIAVLDKDAGTMPKQIDLSYENIAYVTQ